MGKRKLDLPPVIRDGPESQTRGTYSAALHRLLVHRRWTSFPRYMIAGMTASAFRLVTDRRMSVESVTAYNWMAEHFVAADLIGITASQSAGFTFEPTFPLYRAQALLDIKASIDRGAGAILWHNPFVIVTGYDDEEQVLWICDSDRNEYRRLPYGAFGENGTPYWYYQVLESQESVDMWEVCKESLIQAIFKWEVHDPMLPPEDYFCGSAAYVAMVEALETGNYAPEEAAQTLRYYAGSRQDMARYVAELGHLSERMSHVIQEYERLVNVHSEIEKAIEDTTAAWQDKNKSLVRKVSVLLQRAAETEQKAVDAIREAFAETISNRFGDIGLR